MKSRLLVMLYLVVIFAPPYSNATRERKGDTEPFNLTKRDPATQLFSVDDMRELASHDATLKAIDVHLGLIDGRLTTIQTSLDKDVLPTIHVMTFLEWLFALAVGAAVATAVGVFIQNRLKKPSVA